MAVEGIVTALKKLSDDSMTLRDSATPKHMQACTAALAQKENRDS